MRAASIRRRLARPAACRASAVVLLVALLLSALAPRAWDADRAQRAAERLGPRAVEGLKALRPLLAGLVDGDDLTRLEAVNQFYNRRIVFRDDAQVWQADDYWASPLETLQQGAGDCEDYVIAKYFTLLAGGFGAARLRLVYVRHQSVAGSGPGQPHMVLAYYADPNAEPLILDNLIGDIRPASRRPDLTPVFSFNSEGLWQGAGNRSAGDPVARLSPWRDVLQKARAEGFW